MLIDNPLLLFVLCFVVLWLSAYLGSHLRRRSRTLDERVRQDLGNVLAAALTLLGLIIGFSFSMAVTRYDQRKNYEEAEANAIGTEYVRAGLLPVADAAKVRELLKAYVDQRVLFYTTQAADRLDKINASTARLQNDLWSSVQSPAQAQQTPIVALAVAGMNDVLNSQGYTQAAWWNRIPAAAWALMGAIAICCTLLLGYTSQEPMREGKWFFILPLLVSISFLLIADLDSPRGGVIRVQPQNLLSLYSSMQTQ
jgi:hypothetical protein